MACCGASVSGPSPPRFEYLTYASSKSKVSSATVEGRQVAGGGLVGGGGDGACGGSGHAPSVNDSPANRKLRPPLPAPCESIVSSMLETPE